MEELEKAKLLAVAQKIAKSEVAEVRNELIEQINKIQSITPATGVPGRGIIDVALIEEELVLQFNDGSFANLGRIIGEQGIQGQRGEQGLQGEHGITGEQGIQGEQGIPGVQGKQGIQGDKGDRGDQGPRGEKGEKGDTGDRGEQGIPGERGERGERGEQGPAAIDGTAGRDGAKGATGARGDQGVPGRDGKDGKNGKDGLAGPKGDKGDTGEKGDKGEPGSDAEVSKLEKKLSEFSEQVDKRLSKVAFNVAAKGGPAGSGEVKLYRLDDVDYTSVRAPTNGQALVWNVSVGKWAAGTVASGGAGGATNQLVNGSYNVTLQANGVLTVPPNGLIIASTGQYGQQHEMRLGDGLSIGQGGALANYRNETWTLYGQNSDAGTQIRLPGQVDSDNGLSLLIQHNFANSSIDIESAGYKWSFNANSELTLPSAVKLLSGFPGQGYLNNFASLAGDYVYLSSANGYAYIGVENQIPAIGNGPHMWAFDPDGTIRFPDNTIQSTAYTGGGSTTSYLQVANANAKFATKAYAAANSYVKSVLANTNSYIATKASWSSVTGTNTAVRTLISDRLQVANATTLFNTKATWSALISTNTAIRSYVDTSVAAVVNSAPGTLNTLYELAAALSNDPSFATSTASLIATKISVANTKAYIANTNSYIATKASWSALTTTNTAVRALATTKLAVANAFSSLTKYVANTGTITAKTDNVKINDAIPINPAGLLAIVLPDGTTVKIPYWT